MKPSKLMLLKEEFYKKFCSVVDSDCVKEGDGPLYLFKAMGTRPSHVWAWIEEKFK